MRQMNYETRRMLYYTNYEPNRNYGYQTIKTTYHNNLDFDIGIRTKITNQLKYLT